MVMHFVPESQSLDGCSQVMEAGFVQFMPVQICFLSGIRKNQFFVYTIKQELFLTTTSLVRPINTIILAVAHKHFAHTLESVLTRKLALFARLPRHRSCDPMVIGHASGVVAIFFVRAIQALRLAVATQEFGQADGIIVTQKLQ
jgi:hypothetical protein